MAKCSGGSCHTETGQVSSPIRFVAMDARERLADGDELHGPRRKLHLGRRPDADEGRWPRSLQRDLRDVEKTAITDWLNKEVELRNTQGGGGSGHWLRFGTPSGESLSAATQRVLSEYRGCMTIG